MTPPQPPSALSVVHTSLAGLEWPGQSLRAVALPVDFDTVSHERRKAIVAGVIGAMSLTRAGVGIAAPMTGLGVRVIVAAHDGRVLAMANPEIVATHGATISFPEGNLSLPGVSADVERPEGVTVAWRSLHTGRRHEETFDGQLARILFHELDLLDGRMFTDLVPAERIHDAGTPAIRAERAAAAVFGEPEPTPSDGARLNVVTLPRALFDFETSVLRRPARDLELAAIRAADLRELLRAMFQVQHERAGVGLAAPQVGLSLRLAVVDNGVDEPLALINPELLEASEQRDGASEACLSMPGWRGPVERHAAIRIRNHSVTGEPYEIAAEGFLARVIQHELDHLAGVLFTDRMPAGQELEPNGPQVRTETALRTLRRADEAESAARRRRASERRRAHAERVAGQVDRHVHGGDDRERLGRLGGGHPPHGAQQQPRREDEVGLVEHRDRAAGEPAALRAGLDPQPPLGEAVRQLARDDGDAQQRPDQQRIRLADLRREPGAVARDAEQGHRRGERAARHDRRPAQGLVVAEHAPPAEAAAAVERALPRRQQVEPEHGRMGERRAQDRQEDPAGGHRRSGPLDPDAEVRRAVVRHVAHRVVATAARLVAPVAPVTRRLHAPLPDHEAARGADFDRRVAMARGREVAVPDAQPDVAAAGDDGIGPAEEHVRAGGGGEREEQREGEESDAHRATVSRPAPRPVNPGMPMT
jgi:peptide deformylase